MQCWWQNMRMEEWGADGTKTGRRMNQMERGLEGDCDKIMSRRVTNWTPHNCVIPIHSSYCFWDTVLIASDAVSEESQVLIASDVVSEESEQVSGFLLPHSRWYLIHAIVRELSQGMEWREREREEEQPGWVLHTKWVAGETNLRKEQLNISRERERKNEVWVRRTWSRWREKGMKVIDMIFHTKLLPSSDCFLSLSPEFFSLSLSWIFSLTLLNFSFFSEILSGSFSVTLSLETSLTLLTTDRDRDPEDSWLT